jgi:hypothetical protein
MHPRKQSHRARLCVRRFWFFVSLLTCLIRSLFAREDFGRARPRFRPFLRTV